METARNFYLILEYCNGKKKKKYFNLNFMSFLIEGDLK